MAAALDEVALERGDIFIEFAVETGFAGSFHIDQEIVCKENIFLGKLQGFFEDGRVGFQGAYFVGEDFVIEEGEDGVISLGKEVVAFASVGDEDQLESRLLEKVEGGPKRCVGGENVGHGVHKGVESEGAGGLGLEMAVEFLAGEGTLFVGFLDGGGGQGFDCCRRKSREDTNLGKHLVVVEEKEDVSKIKASSLEHVMGPCDLKSKSLRLDRVGQLLGPSFRPLCGRRKSWRLWLGRRRRCRWGR